MITIYIFISSVEIAWYRCSGNWLWPLSEEWKIILMWVYWGLYCSRFWRIRKCHVLFTNWKFTQSECLHEENTVSVSMPNKREEEEEREGGDRLFLWSWHEFSSAHIERDHWEGVDSAFQTPLWNVWLSLRLYLWLRLTQTAQSPSHQITFMAFMYCHWLLIADWTNTIWRFYFEYYNWQHMHFI